MATAALITAFKRLTKHSRREALNALVEELDPYEWRTLHQTTASRSFQYDIIGQLPVELVAQIFAHLDTSTPYRLQRVSRQWHQLLCSPDVLKKSLNSWYDDTVDLAGAEYVDCKLKAKSIHAFRHGGKPHQYFKLDMHHPNGNIVLVEDTLIFTRFSSDYNMRIVYLFNIRTWNLHTLVGEAREKVARLFASDQIVGFTTTNNICYVSRLDGSMRKKFSLPNAALLRSITCRERTVACAGFLDGNVLVYIWNYDNQLGRSFTIDSQRGLFVSPKPGVRPDGMMTLLQPEAERIIVFSDQRGFRDTLDYEQGGLATLKYCQFTYTGDCTFESELTLEGLNAGWLHTQQPQMIPVDRRGTFRFTMLGLSQNICAQFNEQGNKLTNLPNATDESNKWTDVSQFWWKDTFFRALEAPDMPQSARHAIMAHAGTSNQARDKPLITRVSGAYNDFNIAGNLQSIVLNDKFVIRALANTFYVLCYDDSIQLPKESGPFFDIGNVEIKDPLEVG